MTFYKPFDSLGIHHDFNSKQNDTGIPSVLLSEQVIHPSGFLDRVAFPVGFTFSKDKEIVKLVDDQSRHFVNFATPNAAMSPERVESIILDRYGGLLPEGWEIKRVKLTDDLIITPYTHEGQWLYTTQFLTPSEFHFIWYKTCEDEDKEDSVDRDAGATTILVLVILILLCVIPITIAYACTEKKNDMCRTQVYSMQEDEMDDL